MKGDIFRPCFAVEFTTPKRFELQGLWFGPRRPKRVIVFVHGLTGALFHQLSLVELWADADTAVLTFNNRGHDVVSKLYKPAKTRKGYRSIPAGAANEVFTDCVDDIDGALRFARQSGAKEIYLAGHSTGCQKSTYWASRKKNPPVKGIILLAPVSDYAAERDNTQLPKATRTARALVKSGKKGELLPSSVWHEMLDAQRFLSLYTPDSKEEIFSYAQPKKDPRTFASVRLPTLALFAEKDEHRDRPTAEMVKWFQKHTGSRAFAPVVVADALHGFQHHEQLVASTIHKWIKEL